MIQLGERIKELRRRDGRTQETLASALGVTAQAVSRWEKGVCCPDMGMIPSIANYFGVSIDELFGYDNERSKKIDALVERIRAMIDENNGVDVSMDQCIALAREPKATAHTIRPGTGPIPSGRKPSSYMRSCCPG